VLDQKQAFVNIFENFKSAKLVSPRGQLVKELENFSYELPPNVRFMNFKSRNFKLDYTRKEILWYLKGDRYDTSICEHAKMWRSLVNADGSINSNYGQYIFGRRSGLICRGNVSQFENVIDTLKNDRDSRRASIMILKDVHLLSDTPDVPCTYSLNFRIRENKLNVSVLMRSQDAIFGMTNDLPAFSIIHEMVFQSLKSTYPDLVQGNYHHHCNSFHVYERHFEMVDKIVDGDEFNVVDCPAMSGDDEVKFLIKSEFDDIPETFKFTKWLCS